MSKVFLVKSTSGRLPRSGSPSSPRAGVSTSPSPRFEDTNGAALEVWSAKTPTQAAATTSIPAIAM